MHAFCVLHLLSCMAVKSSNDNTIITDATTGITITSFDVRSFELLQLFLHFARLYLTHWLT